ncbi:MAG: hypothetical protein QOG41_1942, partial [Thermoleophilaceae bacterium]|nr:hypothetical protein [Thermoleophilaceae bacterium]
MAKNPVVASVVSVTDRWDLDYTYKDTYQSFRTCGNWATNSRTTNFHVNYKVTWEHVRIPMHEKTQGVIYHAQPVVTANSYSTDGNLPDDTCTDPPVKWSCEGASQLAHSYLSVSGLGAKSSKPKTKVVLMLASDLYVKGFSPATCTASDGSQVDPSDVVDYVDADGDTERLDHTAGAYGELSRKHALSDYKLTSDWYDGKQMK